MTNPDIPWDDVKNCSVDEAVVVDGFIVRLEELLGQSETSNPD